jgi:hypothetical protein
VFFFSHITPGSILHSKNPRGGKIMKRMVVCIVVLCALAVACTKKALPVITERKKEPPPPVINANDVKPDLAKGKMIFTNRCGGCHDLPRPEQYTAPRWETILSVMNLRARLDIDQGVHVTAYLKANAAK